MKIHLQVEQGSEENSLSPAEWGKASTQAVSLAQRFKKVMEDQDDCKDFCILVVVRLLELSSKAHFYFCQELEMSSGVASLPPARLGGEVRDLGQVTLSSGFESQEKEFNKLLGSLARCPVRV